MKKQIRRFVVVLYFIALFAILFCRHSDGLGVGFDRLRLGTAVNLHPFRTIRAYRRAKGILDSRLYFANIYGNALLFLPFGIIVSAKMKPPIAAAATLAVIVSAELLQLVFGVGSADIDDLILNFSGALAGYLLARLVMCIKRRAKHTKENHPHER